MRKKERLAKLAHFALLGAEQSCRKGDSEGVLYDDIALINDLLENLWCAASATHRLVAGETTAP